MKNRPILCSSIDCTACAACLNVCSKGAIRMVENEEGYYNPSIDSNKCVGCRLCEITCPVLNPLPSTTIEPSAYYGWTKNEVTRKKSSSGGVFTELATRIIKQGGVVWGAAFSRNMRLEYMCTDSIENLDSLRRSKYIQAYVGESYKQIKQQLKTRPVLFCGTPCHVAGLYAYLRKRPENLITIDFVCHGCPPSTLWEQYITWLEKKYNDTIIDFNFREKKFGINYNIGTTATFKNKGKKFLYLKDNGYTLAFCKDLTIHYTCVHCKFRSIQRNSDITISDYHIQNKLCNSTDLLQGASCIIINTEIGQSLIAETNMQLHPIPLETIIQGNPSYATIKKRNISIENSIISDYDELINKKLRIGLKDIVKTLASQIIGVKILYKLFK